MISPATVDALVALGAAASPSSPAIADETFSCAYADFDARISAAAGRLASQGVTPGARFGLLARGSVEACACLFGALRAGAVAVPLNPALPAEDLVRQAADCGLSALWAEEAFEKKAATVRSRTGASAVTGSGPAGAVPRAVEEDRPAVILYTSGSTGEPLGVTLSHRNLLANAFAVRQALDLTSADKAFLVLPLFYVYGLSVVLSHLAAGGATVLDNRFLYPQAALEALEASGATGFSGVSSHYAILFEKTDFARRKLPALRAFYQAGDPMPAKLTRRLVEAFPDKKLYLMYGQTEAGPRLTVLAPGKAAAKPASAGRPIPGVEIRILRENGAPCETGEEGEIMAKGAGVMIGYWNRPAETSEAIRDGWLATGDTGHFDAEGDLFVTGRKKNFVKIGGRRVSPAEIERAALEHPDVREAAAVPVDDETLGRRLVLYVAAPKGSEALVAEFLKGRVPPYMAPAAVAALEALPKNAYGKIDRIKLAGDAPAHRGGTS